ncbi:MAG: circularly permuted type 2 ATP-grasp protein [Psychrobacter sp.]|uniref:circularly permuted type 2 ATP-grasp protein n=1 Tax=Psychrobacter sp. TaxID=56811 RepID=UPI002648CD8C|nr:circularly permuted type 2 ATP-grasp protein [Psychrobacter sp.]MDN6276441.1 circularly permuted type 2 ATP-grasp protein [Psychrobacter sp.]MDN6308294.1 circularly permuted type 2 ATP-grasp protein [Psychrobacter sp.]
MSKKSSQSQEQSSDDKSTDSQDQNQTKSAVQEDAKVDSSSSTPTDESKKNTSPEPQIKSQTFDELRTNTGQYRPIAKTVGNWLDNINMDALNHLNEQAENIFYRKGVTFTVYSDAQNIERMIPFDIIPRIISTSEWKQIEAGCKQRITALNAFLHDIYHDQAIMKAGVVPDSYVYASGCYEPWMMGIELDKPIYSHISGIDLIRDEDGNFCVLEDNLRTPSGVSYMLESRSISETLLSEMFEQTPILEVSDYPNRLKSCLASSTSKYDPQIVILTPGRFNSAYYEHAFLANEMNVPLVHGYDLVVEDSKVYMQGIRGKVQVDVIYRRIDDPYIDPLAFQSDSILGVSGLMSAYRSGNVVIINAPGTGVADDKSLYPFVPDMIRFYLDEEPILPNIETYQCRKPEDLKYVLDNLQDLVVKETQGSGGYGMLIGPTSTKEEVEAYRERLLENPAGFIAQPTISLSTNPTAVSDGIAPRHIDLRPFILSHGDGKVDIVPGGLTRVAMVEDSLVVNSSQGGGIKDTWIVDDSKLNDLRAAKTHHSSFEVSALDHTNYYDRAQPIEAGYENLDDAPMILLLSTASQLIWLGRYSERLYYYDSVMKQLVKGDLKKSQVKHLINHLGFSADLEESVKAMSTQMLCELEQQIIPNIVESIETNVQEAKGVIGKDTAELYNLIKRLSSAGTYRAATLQLHACNAAMKQEHPTVACFWQLGRHFEKLERAVLLQEDSMEVSLAFKHWINELPENTRWRELTRLTNQMIRSKRFSDFVLISEEFNLILRQGV